MCVARVRIPNSIRFILAICAAIALLLCAFGTAFALDPAKPLKQFGRQSWQSDTGLPQNTGHATAQTKDGFIWMATEGGLVRFDGQDFRVFDQASTPELPSDSINDLAVDTQGALWISCSGGLVRMDGQRFSRVTASALDLTTVHFVRPLRAGGVLVVTASGVGIGDNSGIHAVAGVAGDVTPELLSEGADGTIWIGMGQQLFMIPSGSAEAKSVTTIADIGQLQAVAASAIGDIWVGGRNGLALFRNATRQRLNLSGLGGDLDVTALRAQPSGDLIIGTDKGLLQYSRGALKRLGPQSGITAGHVTGMFQDREGAVWVAFDLGVARLVRGELEVPLSLPGVLSIFEDREGDMWFGTDVSGATILREQPFSTVTTQDGLSDDFVRAVFQDHAGTVWIGTNRGGLNRIADGQVTRFGVRSGRGILSNVILALAESGGDLWIGTPDGLGRLHEGQLKLFTTSDGLPDDFVRSLYTDRDGTLWIGTRNGLSHYAAGKFTSYSRLDGLGSDLIGSILRTRNGTLWVGTLNGLSRFDRNGFRNFTQGDGLGGNAITALEETGDGDLWIAAHGAGLTRFHDGKFTQISQANSGLPQEIYSILEAKDSAGKLDLWLGSLKGVFRLPLAELNATDGNARRLQFEQFGVADGMKIEECSSGGRPAAWKMTDGSLWFATLKGAASIRPDALNWERPAPLTAIEQVTVDDRAAEPTDEVITMTPGQERLTIHYAGLSFAAPQNVRFRYMLEGFDRNWIDAGSRRTAYYTNVPAGNYRFLVSASNREGQWSEPAATPKIKVKPHFYRALWFYLLAALLAICLVYAVYWLRVRSVEHRYQAVLGERNRIAREIHDTLAQGYVGISVQLELVTQMLRMTRSPGDKGDAVVQQLESTKELVRSSLAEARSSIWNLRASGSDVEDESKTLPSRLANVIQAKQQQGGPPLRLEVRGSFRPVDRRVEDELLRIAQEAIANALRHAAASQVSVVLAYDTGWLKLTVADDGSGFERSAVGPGHYGLQGIEERAAQISASLTIESAKGAGSTVEVAIDLALAKTLEQV